MIEKLMKGLGIENHQLQDPDESYVLTVDNVMKMLAIHMRFRYLSIIIIVHNIHLYNYICLLSGATFL